MRWLFSASGKEFGRLSILHEAYMHLGDSTIRVIIKRPRTTLTHGSNNKTQAWSGDTLTPLFLLNPHLDTDSGDLFCLVWHSSASTLYFGCQNTSIQWFDFRGPPPSEEHTRSDDQATPESIDRVLLDSGVTSGTSTPRRAHKFFDSYPQYERRTPDLNARNPNLTNTRASTPPVSGFATPLHPSLDPCLVPPASQRALSTLQVPPENTIWSAHYGYVYTMAVVPSAREGSDDVPRYAPETAQLVTGSGDATVKVEFMLPSRLFAFSPRGT